MLSLDLTTFIMIEKIIEKSYRKIQSTPMKYIRDLYYKIDWIKDLWELYDKGE